MKINFYNGGGGSNETMSGPGGVMLGPITLLVDATDPMHAVTRQYVLSKANNLTISSIQGGSISSSNLPGFTGDVQSNPGGGATALTPTGVTAGIYSKVTVNTKGLVVSAENMTGTDVPDLPWLKIHSTPTTVNGYGITDTIGTTGGTFTGFLKLNATPSHPQHAATKLYVDNMGTGTSSGVVVGDLIPKPAGIPTPVGFLRANGAVVAKSTYGNLYNVIGDNYARRVKLGAGRPWEQQNYLNSTSNTNISGWMSQTNEINTAVGKSTALVTKNRVYLIGGQNASPSDVVQTAPIDANGVIGAWTLATALPGPAYSHGLFVTKNRVFIAGITDGSGTTTTVYTAPINSDGTLGTWTTGPALPAAMGEPAAFITKNRAYLVSSNYNGAIQTYSAVVSAPINSDGTLGVWTREADLSVPMKGAKAVVTKNKVYFICGNPVQSVAINTIGTIGTIVAEASLPESANGASVVVTKGRVYVIGNQPSQSSFSARINSDDTLGGWIPMTPFANTMYHSSPVITSAGIHMLGGFSGEGTAMKYVYRAPFDGGKNDYSVFYSADFLEDQDSNSFRLPDTTITDYNGSETFIKY